MSDSESEESETYTTDEDMLALSLEMDSDELLFNMTYFGGESTRLARDAAQHEAVAMHSEHNTPYKLNPASAEAVGGLLKEAYRPQQLQQLDEEEDGCRECAVCREDMEEGCSILRIPTCKHFFHEDCILKWSSLQGWCPFCRTPMSKACDDDQTLRGSKSEGQLREPDKTLT